jgi:hypothetical protein
MLISKIIAGWMDDWLALILTDCMELNIMAGVLALTVTDHRNVKIMQQVTQPVIILTKCKIPF